VDPRRGTQLHRLGPLRLPPHPKLGATAITRSEQAAKTAGEAINILIEEGVTERFAGIQAALMLTPQGGTKEREIIMATLSSGVEV